MLTLVRDVPLNPAAETLRRFSALRHRGGVAGLIGTAYGWVLLLKAALFAALLGLAAINRFRLTPALERQDAQKARWALIAGETVLGLMVVLATGVLSGPEPGMHAQHTATARAQR